MGVVDSYCKNCQYASRNTCDYILITGEIRGCDAGKGCTKKKTGKRRKAKV